MDFKRTTRGLSPRFLFLLAIFVITGGILFLYEPPQRLTRNLLVLAFVLAGWMVSLCLHEGAHALTALWGGDQSVRAKGYLSLDPLAYAHPEMTFGLPILILLLGGLGLPGGAVWIERSVLRNRWWDSAVSAAGPAANLLLLAVLSAPFALGLEEKAGLDAFWAGIGFLAYLQATAFVFNMLPIPGFDGFGVLKSHLPYDVQRQALTVAAFSGLVVLGLVFMVPPFSAAIGNMSRSLSGLFGLDISYVTIGYHMFRLRM